MRIDGSQHINIPSILQTLKSKNDPSQQDQPVTSHSVALSTFAETLKSLQRQANASEKARAGKVEKLSQQEQNGKLSVNYEKLAGVLVDHQIIDTKG
jgi:flagellar biosynthesis anti-sigma factor FlgM